MKRIFEFFRWRRKTGEEGPKPLLREPPRNDKPGLVPGEDYYLENGYHVFTAEYLRKRGFCCHSGCRHCPYPK